jgi:hypothetical protein
LAGLYRASVENPQDSGIFVVVPEEERDWADEIVPV